jgi:hypothetical protein
MNNISEKVKVKVKIVFGEFVITEYSDATFRYGDYPYYFDSITKALSWGRAYEQSQKDLWMLQDHIQDLLDQVGN